MKNPKYMKCLRHFDIELEYIDDVSELRIKNGSRPSGRLLLFMRKDAFKNIYHDIQDNGFKDIWLLSRYENMFMIESNYQQASDKYEKSSLIQFNFDGIKILQYNIEHYNGIFDSWINYFLDGGFIKIEYLNI